MGVGPGSTQTQVTRGLRGDSRRGHNSGYLSSQTMLGMHWFPWEGWSVWALVVSIRTLLSLSSDSFVNVTTPKKVVMLIYLLLS